MKKFYGPIPAFAGMTKKKAGITKKKAGMTNGKNRITFYVLHITKIIINTPRNADSPLQVGKQR